MSGQRAWLKLALVPAIALLAAGAATRPAPVNEMKAIAKVIDDNISWFKDKNFDLLFGTYTQGSDLFMFQLDTASTIRGFDEFKKYSVGWKNPDVRYAGHQFHDLRIHLSKAGDTAWFSTELEDCGQAKDRAPRCFTSRYTGVLEKREGRWVIVQQHFSLPADKVAEDWAARTAHLPTPKKPDR